jgi:hypothetical protein
LALVCRRGRHVLSSVRSCAQAAELALETNASAVPVSFEAVGVEVVDHAAARFGIVVGTDEVAMAVVVPAGDGVDEAGWVKGADAGDEVGFGCGGGEALAPAFVEDGL